MNIIVFFCLLSCYSDLFIIKVLVPDRVVSIAIFDLQEPMVGL